METRTGRGGGGGEGPVKGDLAWGQEAQVVVQPSL